MTLLVLLAIFALQPLALIVALIVSVVLDLCDRTLRIPVTLSQSRENEALS